MIIPYLRQDLEILRGNSREDGAPAWLLYDAVRNKYFTLGLTAFKLIKHWRGGEDIANFEKKVNAEGVETTGDEIKSFLNFLPLAKYHQPVIQYKQAGKQSRPTT